MAAESSKTKRSKGEDDVNNLLQRLVSVPVLTLRINYDPKHQSVLYKFNIRKAAMIAVERSKKTMGNDPTWPSG